MATLIPPTPPAPPSGTPVSNPIGWANFNRDWLLYQQALEAYNNQQNQIGQTVPTDMIMPGGRDDIPPGTGTQGQYGSRFNEIHQLIPGTEDFNEHRTADEIGVWIDARTGLLRFDRLPNASVFEGRFRNEKGGIYSGFTPPNNDPPSIPVPPVIPPPPVTPPPTTPPPTQPPPPVTNVNLRDIVTVSTHTIDRQYIKGTMRSIPTEIITLTNISNDVDVTVSLLGTAGVSFSPSTFELPKKSKKNIDVLFDTIIIDAYPEGISAVNCAINLSSNSAVVNPLPPTPPSPPLPPSQPQLPSIPPIITPPPPPPTLPVTTINWIETRYWANNAQSLTSAQISNLTRETVTQVPSISYNGSLPSDRIITWERTFQWEANKRIKFDVRIDDGMRISINGQRVFDSWRDQVATPYTFYFDTGNQNTFNVFVEYYNSRGPGTAVVGYTIQQGQLTPDLPTPPPISPPPDELIPYQPTPPVVSIPIPTQPPLNTIWINGVTGMIMHGTPPSDWVEDPATNKWYPPDHPYVLSGFGKNPIPTQPPIPPVITNVPPQVPNTLPPVIPPVPTLPPIPPVVSAPPTIVPTTPSPLPPSPFTGAGGSSGGSSNTPFNDTDIFRMDE